MEARVTSHSQTYRLREGTVEAEVQRGEEIRADLSGIRVTGLAREWFAALHKAGAGASSAPSDRSGCGR